MHNLAARLLRGSMRGQPPLSRPRPQIKLTRTSTGPQRLHATATSNLTGQTSTFHPDPSPSPAAGTHHAPGGHHPAARDFYTDSFPCTLHYYSSRGPRVSLFDHDRELEDASRDGARQGGLYMHHDLVSCDDRGLVDPSYTGRFRWNGLHMYPNTVNSVELLRSFSDWADECRLLGQDVPFPWMFTISKGTPLPHHLFLVHEDSEQFHLMARETKSISVLSEELNEFFSSNGTRMPEREWLNRYFIEGCNTYCEHEWLTR